MISKNCVNCKWLFRSQICQSPKKLLPLWCWQVRAQRCILGKEVGHIQTMSEEIRSQLIESENQAGKSLFVTDMIKLATATFLVYLIALRFHLS